MSKIQPFPDSYGIERQRVVPKARKPGPAPVNVAYSELSPAAFALWIRIQGEEDALRKGPRRLARAIGVHKRKLQKPLQELDGMGYISSTFHKVNPGIVIIRRVLVDSRAGFQRLY